MGKKATKLVSPASLKMPILPSFTAMARRQLLFSVFLFYPLSRNSRSRTQSRPPGPGTSVPKDFHPPGGHRHRSTFFLLPYLIDLIDSFFIPWFGSVGSLF